jgi:hypothetical protein
MAITKRAHNPQSAANQANIAQVRSLRDKPTVGKVPTMKVVNRSGMNRIALSEDGDSICIPPGVHDNIHTKFNWNLPSHTRNATNHAKVVKSRVGPIDLTKSALAQAKAAKEAAKVTRVVVPAATASTETIAPVSNNASPAPSTAANNTSAPAASVKSSK